VKTAALLLPLATIAACSGAPAPYVTTVGILKPGATLTVRIDSGTVNAYQPKAGQRRDLFTIAATAAAKGTPPPAPRVRAAPLGLVVQAGALNSLLVRVPDGVNFVVESRDGDVNVTDIAGNTRIAARHGNVSIKLPGYAQAAVGNGNLSVMMGAADWPGTLHFTTGSGDIEVWISARAAFAVHLHTGDGTLFTDFGLRGSSSGTAETIDGIVNGGSASRVDIETAAGAIRLLRLQPQP
jgi:hypothetical protein